MVSRASIGHTRTGNALFGQMSRRFQPQVSLIDPAKYRDLNEMDILQWPAQSPELKACWADMETRLLVAAQMFDSLSDGVDYSNMAYDLYRALGLAD